MNLKFTRKRAGAIGIALLLLLFELAGLHGRDNETKFGGLVAPTSSSTASPSALATPYPWPTPTSAVDSSLSGKNVLTFMCELSDQYKPDSFYRACADGYDGIGKITWKSWTASGAIGFGQDYANPCNPNCASDQIVYTQKLALKLDTPIQMGKKVYLTLLHYAPVDSNGNVKAGTKWSTWNIGLDYRQMQSYMK